MSTGLGLSVMALCALVGFVLWDVGQLLKAKTSFWNAKADELKVQMKVFAQQNGVER